MSSQRYLIVQRRVSREVMMKYLYQIEMLNQDWDDIQNGLNDFLDSIEENALKIYDDLGGREIDILETNREAMYDTSYLMDISKAISDNIDEIDSIIDSTAKGWSVSTLPKVDLSILRLSIAEIKYMAYTIPSEVACNEAIELAKKYCEDDAYKYINGILGTVSRM